MGYTAMIWIDTIIQNLVVKEGRKDSKYGAQDLKYFDWTCIGIGGVIPSSIGLIMNIWLDTRFYECFWSSLYGLLMIACSLQL